MKRSQEPPDTLPPKKKRKAVNHIDIAWGEELRPVIVESVEFLKLGPASSTTRPYKQPILVTITGDLAVAELVNCVLKGVVDMGEANAVVRQVELEVEGALNAMKNAVTCRAGALAGFGLERCQGARQGGGQEGEREEDVGQKGKFMP